MPVTIDPNNSTCQLSATVNGAKFIYGDEGEFHTLSGGSTNASVWSLESQELYQNIERTAEGVAIGYRREKDPGVLTITLTPISPSLKWFGTLFSRLRDRVPQNNQVNQIVIAATIIDETVQVTHRCTGGLMRNAKLMSDFNSSGGNSDMPIVIEFDDVDHDYSGFNSNLIPPSE